MMNAISGLFGLVLLVSACVVNPFIMPLSLSLLAHSVTGWLVADFLCPDYSSRTYIVLLLFLFKRIKIPDLSFCLFVSRNR